MKMRDLIAKELDAYYRVDLATAMKERYGLEVETAYSILGGCLLTIRVDDKDFTQKQSDYIDAFAAGYSAALERVKKGATS